jgi:hypothetical protein
MMKKSAHGLQPVGGGKKWKEKRSGALAYFSSTMLVGFGLGRFSGRIEFYCLHAPRVDGFSSIRCPNLITEKPQLVAEPSHVAAVLPMMFAQDTWRTSKTETVFWI